MKNVYKISYYTCLAEMEQPKNQEPKTFVYSPNGYYSYPKTEMEFYNKENELRVYVEADSLTQALTEWTQRYPSHIIVSIRDIRVEDDQLVAVA